MNNDVDIKRMFEAQRKLDEQVVPDFDEIYANAVALEPHGALPRFRPWVVAAVSIVVAASFVFGFVAWDSSGDRVDNAANPASRSKETRRVNPVRDGVVEVTVVSDVQTLNRACDALQATIRNVSADLITLPESDRSVSEQGMEWPTETDSLITYR